jgi:GAF domain-containing protein
MKRRSKVRATAAKARRPKSTKLKTPTEATGVASPARIGEGEIARLTRELNEERKQRTATSEVLHLLSGSRTDLDRLFDAILSNATKLCRANFGALFLCEADAFRIVAQHNAPPTYAELRRREPLVRGRLLFRAAETKQVVQIADVRENVASNPADKDVAAFAKVSGVRTVLIVPMLKDGEVVGTIVIYRQEIRTFNDREIELLKSFAAQAVIAIENARLLNELRQSLEQQTATSEVLQVISSSPGALQPVFDAMLTNATRLCEASFGILLRYENAAFHVAASHNAPPAFVELRRREPTIRASGVLRRVVATKQLLHISDCLEDASYKQGDADFVRFVDLCGARSFIAAPMLKDDELVGTITVFHQEVRPFTDKQVELVKNFAAQAVIAIENARLLNELRQSLEQQTATSEVLQVISSAPGDLEPIFATMLERAARICDAKFAALYRLEGDALRLIATHDVPPAFAEAQGRVVHPAPGGALDAVMKTGRTAHLSDLAAGIPRSYVERHPRMQEAVKSLAFEPRSACQWSRTTN